MAQAHDIQRLRCLPVQSTLAFAGMDLAEAPFHLRAGCSTRARMATKDYTLTIRRNISSNSRSAVLRVAP